MLSILVPDSAYKTLNQRKRESLGGAYSDRKDETHITTLKTPQITGSAYAATILHHRQKSFQVGIYLVSFEKSAERDFDVSL